MMRIQLILFLFFSLPALLLSGMVRSPALLAVSAGWGLIATAWLLARSGEAAYEDLRPAALDPGMESRLARILLEAGSPRLRVEFLKFKSTDPVVKVQIRGRGELRVFISVAFLETAADSDFRRIFSSWSPDEFRKIRIANIRDSIRSTLSGWKGGTNRFRYWFVSFWLLPFERLLQIARY
ncbi:MAG: hypothetical protein EBX52_10270 [Proteobacteria bacterium]|nr:hypothetical protein [Pseudomonadota bacterium]